MRGLPHECGMTTKKFPSGCALVLVMLLPSVLGAQLRLEIDHSSGREVVNDWTYGFREFVAVDRDRGLVYVVDASDPLAVMAFAVADGTLVGTFGGGEGIRSWSTRNPRPATDWRPSTRTVPWCSKVRRSRR